MLSPEIMLAAASVKVTFLPKSKTKLFNLFTDHGLAVPDERARLTSCRQLVQIVYNVNDIHY